MLDVSAGFRISDTDESARIWPKKTQEAADGLASRFETLTLLQRGWFDWRLGAGLCYEWFLFVTERLRRDLVMALAVVHPRAFKRPLDFEQIAAVLAAFTRDSLLVDFIPPDDPCEKERHSERHAAYRLEAFRRRFHDIRILPSCPEFRALLPGSEGRI